MKLTHFPPNSWVSQTLLSPNTGGFVGLGEQGLGLGTWKQGLPVALLRVSCQRRALKQCKPSVDKC